MTQAISRHPLAIITRHVGETSETFIRKHIEQVLPGATVVIAQSYAESNGTGWSVTSPALVLDCHEPGLPQRVLSYTARLLGGLANDRDVTVTRFLRRHGVEVVLTEYLNAGVSWLPLAKRLGLRFFAHAHGYDLSRLFREQEWRQRYRQLEAADGIITVNRIQRDRLISLGIPAHKIHMIPSGVDVPVEPPQRFSKSRDVVRCVSVGRMVAKKAPIFTLEAFRKASEVYPQLRLDYIGSGTLLPAARQFVQAFGLSDRVTLHGATSHEVVKHLMGQADIYLQHSITDPETGDEEGLPVAIQEAMATGLPVVSTNHAGIPEAVEDEGTGYLVDEGDTAGMAGKLVVLAQDPDLRRKMGLAGWRRAEEYFSWGKSRRDLLRILGLDQDRGMENGDTSFQKHNFKMTLE